MKISIITVCYNSAPTIVRALASAANQTHPDIEHIVIDGASRDGTQALIEANCGRVARFVSEPDKGLYDAMNKGVSFATGDAIALLNSDDCYATNDIVARVAAILESELSLDGVSGDVAFFRANKPDTVIRRVRSDIFKPSRLRFGVMPAHPSLFLRRAVYDRTGPFRIDYRIAADFEFLVRAYKSGALNLRYVPDVFVRMQMGGASTSGLRSAMTLNSEMRRACLDNGLDTHMGWLLLRYWLKLPEVIFRT